MTIKLNKLNARYCGKCKQYRKTGMFSEINPYRRRLFCVYCVGGRPDDGMILEYLRSQPNVNKNPAIATENVKKLKLEVDLLKKQRGCESGICKWSGELHPELLAFHHLDPSNKLANVTSLYHKGRELTMREIDKCIVVCWNCHILIHRELT